MRQKQYYSKTRRVRWLSALLLLLGLVCAGGCGDDGQTAAPSASGQRAADSDAQPKRKKIFLAFSGGPTGGTFNFFANKISVLVTQAHDHLDIAPKGSAGSAENQRALHQGDVDLSIVYAGDAYLGYHGELADDDTPYTNVRALAFLYGAPAQLLVRADSGITSVQDLKGRKIAIGNPGSGAALSAERFFRLIGLWDKIDIQHQGYSQAAANFSHDRIDGFWVLAGYPNSSIIEAASHVPASLVPLGGAAEAAGLYNELPFYSPASIPAGTYQNQFETVSTFQDIALLCASKDTDPAAVQDILATIFSEQGLASMVNAHRAAKDMSTANSLMGIHIPMHPGAVTFWEGRGLTVPASLK